MFGVNGMEITKDEFASRVRAYRDMEHFRAVEGKRYALCLTNPEDIVSLVLFLRDQGGSVLLMHGETPFSAAQKLAEDAQCGGLVYQDPGQYIPFPHEREREAEAALYQFSSGTTGEARLIGRTWEQIERELTAYNSLFTGKEDRTPIVLASITHSYGLLCGVLSALKRGSKPVIVTNQNPKYALSVIQDTPRHIVYGVPLLFHVMTGFSQERVRFDHIMTSGAPLPEGLYHRLRDVTDVMMQQYGCTEAGCVSIALHMQTNLDIGIALPHVEVITGRDQSQPSEIIVSLGHARIHTRDLGYRTESGRIQWVSRLDDVINVAGLKVFPAEVEDVLNRIEGVQEAVVYRGQHPVSGEIVKAQVVAKPGVTLDPAQIRKWCFAQLPPYKVPSEIQLVTAIPKSATGKVSRNMLERGDVRS